MARAKLFVENVAAGQEAPVLTHTLTRTDLVRYAGASGDFNPMHHDEIAATAAGMPSVFGHGMYSMGLVATALADFVGAGSLTRFRVRFTKQTWPGEELRTRITVTEVIPGEVPTIVMRCGLENAGGEVKVEGEAAAVVASRGALT